LEFGYTDEWDVRRPAHARHEHSVPLIGLFLVIAKTEFPNDGYKLHQKVFFACWQSQQAVVGEHLFSIIMQSYIWYGGMNSTIAGISNTSNRKLPVWVFDFWADWSIDRRAILRRYKEEIKKINAAIELKKEYDAHVSVVEDAKTARTNRWETQQRRDMLLEELDISDVTLDSMVTDAVEYNRPLVVATIGVDRTEKFFSEALERMQELKGLSEDIRKLEAK
jgi:hypothetical protein